VDGDGVARLRWGLVGEIDTHLRAGAYAAPTADRPLPRFLYTGQEYDAASETYNYKARQYDPGTGRFLSQDPALDGTNLYSYVYNDPLNRTDPSGLLAAYGGFDFGSRGFTVGTPLRSRSSSRDGGGDDRFPGINFGSPAASRGIDSYIGSLLGNSYAPSVSSSLSSSLAGSSWLTSSSVGAGTRNFSAGQVSLLAPPEIVGQASVLEDLAYALANVVNFVALPQVSGSLKTVGGVVETGLGVAGLATTSWTGVGGVVSGLALAHGLDTIQSGVRQVYSGGVTPSYTSKAITKVTGSRLAGELGDAGVGVLLTAGSNIAVKAASATQSTARGLSLSNNVLSAPQRTLFGEINSFGPGARFVSAALPDVSVIPANAAGLSLAPTPTVRPLVVSVASTTGELTTTVPRGDFYSVAFETRLNPSSYPGVSRAMHFREANEALLQTMEVDASFAQNMRQLGISLERTPTGLAPRQPPKDWSWHHAQEPGVMQLVPGPQHTPGTIWWDTLHPNGQGGYAIWGR